MSKIKLTKEGEKTFKEKGWTGWAYRAIFWIKGTKKPTKVIKDRIAELDVD